MKNIRSLEKLLPEGAAWDEDLTYEGGAIYVYAPRVEGMGKYGIPTQLCMSGIHSSLGIETRATIIEALIEDIKGGIQDANEDTIHAMGWEK